MSDNLLSLLKYEPCVNLGWSHYDNPEFTLERCGKPPHSCLNQIPFFAVRFDPNYYCVICPYREKQHVHFNSCTSSYITFHFLLHLCSAARSKERALCKLQVAPVRAGTGLRTFLFQYDNDVLIVKPQNFRMLLHTHKYLVYFFASSC